MILWKEMRGYAGATRLCLLNLSSRKPGVCIFTRSQQNITIQLNRINRDILIIKYFYVQEINTDIKQK